MARGVDGRNLVSKVISDKQSSTEMHRCSARCTTSLLSWQNPEIWCDSCFYNNPALRNCTSKDGVPCGGFKCSITQKSLKNCSSGRTAETRPESNAVKKKLHFEKQLILNYKAPGWQKLHGSTGGTRRKVWTRTKILSLNIRYFVAK